MQTQRNPFILSTYREESKSPSRSRSKSKTRKRIQSAKVGAKIGKSTRRAQSQEELIPKLEVQPTLETNNDINDRVDEAVSEESSLKQSGSEKFYIVTGDQKESKEKFQITITKPADTLGNSMEEEKKKETFDKLKKHRRSSVESPLMKIP